MILNTVFPFSPILTSAMTGFLIVLSFKLMNILLQKIKLFYKQYRMMKDVPGPPNVGHIFGSIKQSFISTKEIPKVMGNVLNCYGSILGLWIPFFPVFLIGRADYAESFFASKDVIKADFMRFMRIFVGQGLILHDGQLWKERRKLIDPAFHSTVLTAFCDIFVQNSIKFVQKLREHPSDTAVDVTEIGHLTTLDNICETAMGVKVDALNNPAHECIKALEFGEEAFYVRSMTPWYWYDFLFFSVFPYGWKVKRFAGTVNNFTQSVIKEKRTERAKLRTEGAREIKSDKSSSGRKRLVFLDLVMDAAETQSVPLSNEDLMDEVKTFITAGHSTMASALDFVTYQLGLHPDIQEKCCSELESIFNGSDRKPTATDLQDMKYLEQVIKESLRIYPAVPCIARTTIRDTKIGECWIPEGTTIVVDIFHMHRDPMYFPDPEKFDPDRFSPENSVNRPAYAFIPFSAGPRNCIGQKFAIIQLKILLTYILRNFTLESLDGHKELPVWFGVSLRPFRKLEIMFRPKKDSHI